jgi:hypothetical protein
MKVEVASESGEGKELWGNVITHRRYSDLGYVASFTNTSMLRWHTFTKELDSMGFFFESCRFRFCCNLAMHSFDAARVSDEKSTNAAACMSTP